MAIIARENSSLRRRSGVRNAAAKACSTVPSPGRSVEISNATRESHGSALQGPLQGRVASLRAVGAGGLRQTTVVLPPAALIFSAADEENACACTSTLI